MRRKTSQRTDSHSPTDFADRGLELLFPSQGNKYAGTYPEPLLEIIQQVRSGTPSVIASRSMSHPRDSTHATYELDTLSSDSTDSLREHNAKLTKAWTRSRKSSSNPRRNSVKAPRVALHLSLGYKTSPFRPTSDYPCSNLTTAIRTQHNMLQPFKLKWSSTTLRIC
ncbi:hypothetical protein B296_00055338 [Ensete ventricosum]|uniref:Uncharacterized protein n=1 Tax=Ensete ventricosum TaxID=4639 RepID=A0A426Y022_ENSVE|nr:hypothetical protein B296_00055338 [Ensete ventricosum]